MTTNKQLGNIGEAWVFYQLARRGYDAVLPRMNYRGVDILATDAVGRPFAMQVKTRAAGRKKWMVSASAENATDPRVFYALVELQKEDRNPVVWIVPAALVAQFVRESHAAWLAGTKASGEPRRDNTIRNITDQRQENVGGLENFPPGWLDPFREAWEIIEHEVA